MAGLRDGVDGDEGWPLYLARYAALAHGKALAYGSVTQTARPPQPKKTSASA